MKEEAAQNLTKEELINFKAYSDLVLIKRDYDRRGLSDQEEYLIKTFFQPRGRLLDLGCGAGRTTVVLKEKGYEVIGIDIVPQMIKLAKAKYPYVDFRIMNACDLKFEDRSFDYVFFSFNGIDNILPENKRVKCLREVFRVLKPKGVFIYSSHNAFCIPQSWITLSLSIKNILNLKFFTQYRVEETISDKMLVYHQSPFKQKLVLEHLGFRNVRIIGKRFKNYLSIHFLELDPHFVAQK